MIEDKPIICKFSPDRFRYDNYEPDYSRLGLSYNYWPQDLVSGEKELIRALKEKAVGYCEAESLFVRPRKNMYAIMCEDDEGMFWFHIKPETINHFRIASSYSEARHIQFMKPIWEKMRKTKGLEEENE